MRLYHKFHVSNGDEIFPIHGIVEMEIVLSGGKVEELKWFMPFEGARIKPVWVTNEMIEKEKLKAVKNRKK